MNSGLRADEWNAMIDDVRRGRILSLLVLEGQRNTHPWFTRPSWNAEEQHWECIVRPGFVNGLDVTASVLGDDDVLVDRPLTDVPFIPLSAGWRKVGADGDPVISSASDTGDISVSYEPVPEFFVALGVAGKASATISVDDPASVLSALSDVATSPRRLCAMDLVLYHDRPGLSADSNGQPTLANAPQARQNAYIRATRKIADATTSDPLQQLAGNWQQDRHDSILIATVFMLSPEDAGSEAEVDETWTPYVKHEVWWNLCYAHNVPDFAVRSDLALQTGLAGGVADPLIQQILDANNAASAAALDILTTTQVEGRWWSV